MKNENLGKKGTDKITGFKGVITAWCEYLYGCGQYLLMPKMKKDGVKPSGEWFDEGRVDVGKRFINPNDVQVEENGCEYRSHPDK